MAKNNFFNFESVSANYKKLYDEIGAGNSCSVFGVQNSMQVAITSNLNKKLLYVVADGVSLLSATEQFELMGLKTLKFSAISDYFLYKHAQSSEAYNERILTLNSILSGNFDVVVAEIGAIFEFLPSIAKFKQNTIKLLPGQNIKIAELEAKLMQAGYKLEELIDGEGQFARRGEIVDVFPLGAKTPFRIDFFDTEIETIKVFDIESQKGTKEVKSLNICPCTCVFINENEVSTIASNLQKIKNNDVASETLTIFDNNIDEIILRLENGDRRNGLSVLAPYILDFRASIFDYFNATKQDFVVVINEAKRVFDSLTSFKIENGERLDSLRKERCLIAGKNKVSFTDKEVLKYFENSVCLAFLKITNSNKFFSSKAVFNFKTMPSSRYVHNLKEFSFDVNKFLASGYKLYIFSGDANGAQICKNILSSHGISLEVRSQSGFMGESSILPVGYESGFILPEEKIAVIGTYDVFPKKRKTNTLLVKKENVFNIPKMGDYVVHHFHGIGICEGVTRLSGMFGTQDYVVVRYRDGDKLYVPTTQMDLLDKYTGSGEPKRLSKIGGQDFEAIKNKVKSSVKKLAFSLTELYAKRQKVKGFTFSEDTPLQIEFEKTFPYVETEDQLVTIDEVKNDMQSSKVMDRLVCGDVGFGKTEIALRAAFKAISDGKQVAFIAPTTILSEQHFNTAKARMNFFGVDIEVLNRFKTKKQISSILSGIMSGRVDMVCGTHRILSDDVKFKNLGLIILDEEQKFGVEDKEKLKHKYPNVDVLTLSATPIPRTLNMSLSGIRDISIIATPPSERLPIQTYVMEFSEPLVRDAILREIGRDGQVFILFNSVEKIYGFADRIKKLVPEASVAVAHGQMGARELENIVYDFYHKKYDILICTTIIENGIDIENANTLIVCDADKLGLSQLYQIRGRVGRGAKMAYAYFTYQKDKILSEEAFKRLDAMSEFCEFGSGFKLAMRDLEIRGGGNILGAEQSGHMQKVGYDMFMRLLSDAIKELKGEKVKEEKEVQVKISINAFVPESYVATSEERMVVYKRISSVDSLEKAEILKNELKQNYGAIPVEVQNLIDIALVRKLAEKIGASQVISQGKSVFIVFDEKESLLSNQNIVEMVYKFRMQCAIDNNTKPSIRFDKMDGVADNFEAVKHFLLKASEFDAQK